LNAYIAEGTTMKILKPLAVTLAGSAMTDTNVHADFVFLEVFNPIILKLLPTFNFYISNYEQHM